MDPSQFSQLPANVALIVALVAAVLYLTKREEKSTARIVELLTDTLANNTDALRTVADVLQRCHGANSHDTAQFRKPTHHPHPHHEKEHV